MTKQPQRKRCTWGCGLVPIAEFADHMFLHEAQTELVPLKEYTKPLEPRRVKRKRLGADGRLA